LTFYNLFHVCILKNMEGLPMSNSHHAALARSKPIHEKHEVLTEIDPQTGTVIYEQWYKDGKRDRSDGPAYIVRDATTGTVIGEAWYENGKLHRIDGPTNIERDAKTGIVTDEIWWKDNKQFTPSPEVRAAWLQKSGEQVAPPSD
jgi:hypothetical protein